MRIVAPMTSRFRPATEPRRIVGFTRSGKAVYPIAGGAPDKKTLVVDKLGERKQELEHVTKYADTLVERIRSGHATEAERAELEPLTEKAEGLQKEIGELESDLALAAKISRIGTETLGAQTGPVDGGPKYRDAVDAFMRSETFLHFAKDPSQRKGRWATDEVEFRAAPVDPSVANPADLVPTVLPGVVAPFTFPLNVGSLFSQGNMDRGSIAFLTIPTADGQADMTAIATQKAGPATMTWDIDTIAARKVTASMIIPEESLEDLPAVETQIRNLLLVGPLGLAEKLEDQYINGSGMVNDMVGILSLNPDDVTLPGERLSKSIFKAATEIENETGMSADAFVMNPTDYFAYYTEEDEDLRPLWGPWGARYGGDQSGAPSTMKPVTSRKLAAGTVIVGAFKSTTRYIRKAVSIRASAEGLGLADFNLVLFVAEARELLQHPYGKKPYRVVSTAS